jgi:hypothetical protein
MNEPTELPLTETTYFILLSLLPKPKHGYAIMKDVQVLSEERIVLSTGTLYGALKRLLDQGWIERLEETDPKGNARDRKVYIDLQFYETMKTRLGAPGDFAQAYVIAHEVGHHVQTLLGISEQVSQMQARLSEGERNELSVRVELKRITLPACGRITRRRRSRFSSRGTSRRR